MESKGWLVVDGSVSYQKSINFSMAYGDIGSAFISKLHSMVISPVTGSTVTLSSTGLSRSCCCCAYAGDPKHRQASKQIFKKRILFTRSYLLNDYYTKNTLILLYNFSISWKKHSNLHFFFILHNYVFRQGYNLLRNMSSIQPKR